MMMQVWWSFSSALYIQWFSWKTSTKFSYLTLETSLGSKAVHMCSSSLHDPILPHVQFQQEYALACLATCAVPTNMYDPILPHVQFQQEYELASLGSFTHPYFFYVPCMWMFFNLFLSSLLHRSFSDVLYPSMISYLIYQNSKTWYLHDVTYTCIIICLIS